MTGLTVFRLAEVQQPNSVQTLSWVMSFSALRANVGQSEAPSSTTASTWRPKTPPLEFSSSMANKVASITDFSLMAMLPVREWRTPTLRGCPPARAPEPREKKAAKVPAKRTNAAKPAQTPRRPSDRFLARGGDDAGLEGRDRSIEESCPGITAAYGSSAAAA